MTLIPPTSQPPTPQKIEFDSNKLKSAAEKIETHFLKEMLMASDLYKPSESFGGGAGEEQFRSFIIDAQAKALRESHDFGLAKSIYESLVAKETGKLP